MWSKGSGGIRTIVVALRSARSALPRRRRRRWLCSPSCRRAAAGRPEWVATDLPCRAHLRPRPPAAAATAAATGGSEDPEIAALFQLPGGRVKAADGASQTATRGTSLCLLAGAGAPN